MDPLDFYTKIQPLVEQDAQRIATDVYNTLGTQYDVPQVPYHEHNGVDSPNLPFLNIDSPIQYIHWTVPGTSAATSTNYGVFWIAPAPCTVIGFKEVHQTASTSGTLQLEKLTGTTASGAGTALLTATVSLSSTANTIQTANLLQTRTTGTGVVNLATGDRLSLLVAGTLTNGVNVTTLTTIQF